MSQPNSSVSKYSASGPMLGYLYQVRVALLWAAKQSVLGDFSLRKVFKTPAAMATEARYSTW